MEAVNAGELEQNLNCCCKLADTRRSFSLTIESKRVAAACRHNHLAKLSSATTAVGKISSQQLY